MSYVTQFICKIQKNLHSFKNKDEDVHRFAIKVELLKRGRQRERESEREREREREERERERRTKSMTENVTEECDRKVSEKKCDLR